MAAILGNTISLLIPPITFAITAGLGLVLLLRWRRYGFVVAAISVAGLLILAMPAVSGTLLFALERGLPTKISATQPPQAIVVLGGDVSRNAPPGLATDVGPLSLERVRTAATLERLTGLPILITGGPITDRGESVASVMARSLKIDFNVTCTWTETQARNTWENAAYAADILRARDISSVYVVTQGWHMRRALLAFRHTGLRVVAAPTDYRKPPSFLDIDYYFPQASALTESYYALHEWIGYIYYDAFG